MAPHGTKKFKKKEFLVRHFVIIFSQVFFVYFFMQFVYMFLHQLFATLQIIATVTIHRNFRC